MKQGHGATVGNARSSSYTGMHCKRKKNKVSIFVCDDSLIESDWTQTRVLVCALPAIPTIFRRACGVIWFVLIRVSCVVFS